MKDKLKRFSLIALWIAGVTFTIPNVIRAYDMALTNYTTQQIANWMFGNNFSISNGSGLYNAGDSTLNVRTKSNSDKPDSTTWLISDTTNATTAYTNDTLRFYAHYNYRYKFSVTCDKILTIQNLRSTDSTRIPANGSFSSDYLDPKKDTTWVVRGGTGTTYYMGSQGK